MSKYASRVTVVSRSMRSRRSVGKRSWTSASRRSVPMPSPRIIVDPQLGQRPRRAAVVAVAAASLRMEHERHTAAVAGDRLAAAATDNNGGAAAPVEEEDRLAAGVVALAQRLVQVEGERTAIAGAQLLAQVDNLDGWQWASADALVQRDQLETTCVRSVVRLHPWCGAAQHHGHAGEAAAFERDVDGVVSGDAVLLVRTGVLLVDDDHAEPGQWGEDRAA